MVRRPGDGLHRGQVFRVSLNRSQRMKIPDVESVVVAPGGQVLVVWGPLQATDLLTMSSQSSLAYDTRSPDVSLQN